MNLNQITLKSQDVNRAVEFYLKLGLRLIVDFSPRYARFECPKGESTFSISHSDVVRNACTILYFELKDLDEIYQKLKAQGIEFTSEPEDKRWLWREVAFKDPDGNPLILYSAGINRKNPPWRV